MSRNLRLFAALLTGLGLLGGAAPSATGSTSRVAGLGGDGDFLEDGSNVLRWFGSLPDYPNLAYLELGDLLHPEDAGSGNRVVGQGGGVHLELDRAGRWGTGAVYLADVLRPDEVPGSLSLLWARAFGGVQAGLFYNWALVEEREMIDAPDRQRRESDHTLGIGLRWELGGRLYADLAGDWSGIWRRYWTTVDAVEPDSTHRRQDGAWNSFSIRARAFVGLTEELALVPVITHRRREHLAFLDAYRIPADLTATETSVGVGVNLFRDSDNMLVLSWSYRFGDEDYRDVGLGGDFRRLSGDLEAFLLRIGLESRLSSWLTLRGAVRQAIPERLYTAVYAGVDEEVVLKAGTQEPELNFTLGLALHFGSFDADLVLDDEAPFGLGNLLLGGDGDRAGNFSSITLSYRF